MGADDESSTPLEAGAGDIGDEAAEAFGVLGDDLRLAILLALWDHREPWERHQGLAFSELFDRLEVSDSGQFNYHLDKLVPRFVERSDETYRLTQTGFKLIQTVMAGTGVTESRMDKTTVDRDCPFCEHPVQLRARTGADSLASVLLPHGWCWLQLE